MLYNLRSGETDLVQFKGRLKQGRLGVLQAACLLSGVGLLQEKNTSKILPEGPAVQNILRDSNPEAVFSTN